MDLRLTRACPLTGVDSSQCPQDRCFPKNKHRQINPNQSGCDPKTRERPNIYLQTSDVQKSQVEQPPLARPRRTCWGRGSQRVTNPPDVLMMTLNVRGGRHFTDKVLLILSGRTYGVFYSRKPTVTLKKCKLQQQPHQKTKPGDCVGACLLFHLSGITFSPPAVVICDSKDILSSDASWMIHECTGPQSCRSPAAAHHLMNTISRLSRVTTYSPLLSALAVLMTSCHCVLTAFTRSPLL